MLFLVMDILDFSQIESRSFILNMNEEFVVEDMLSECIDLFRYKAQEKGVTLGFTMVSGNWSGGGPHSMKGNAVKRRVRTD
jgi:signal transduction histidine kinase